MRQALRAGAAVCRGSRGSRMAGGAAGPGSGDCRRAAPERCAPQSCRSDSGVRSSILSASWCHRAPLIGPGECGARGLHLSIAACRI